MEIRLITMPFDLGHRCARMGAGPVYLVERNIEEMLDGEGHATRLASVDLDDDFPTEIAAAFSLNRSLAGQIPDAAHNGHFPIVLSGNCGCCLGMIAGLARRAGREASRSS